MCLLKPALNSTFTYKPIHTHVLNCHVIEPCRLVYLPFFSFFLFLLRPHHLLSVAIAFSSTVVLNPCPHINLLGALVINYLQPREESGGKSEPRRRNASQVSPPYPADSSQDGAAVQPSRASPLRMLPSVGSQSASSVAHMRKCNMEENMDLSENDASNKTNNADNYRKCICTILKLLADFGQELKLGEAVLKVDVNVDALGSPSLPRETAYNTLLQHISKLQSVSESLKTLAAAERHSKALASRASAAVVPSSRKEETAVHRPPLSRRGISADEEESEAHVDDLTVQIKAGKSEIDRRIFAFMERKQMEINENNVREFCNVIDCNQENSCARTDAVFTPYPGFKSHVKVTRVVNTYGPQTRGAGGHGETGDPQKAPPVRECGNPAIEERLHNMETHLKLPTAGPVPLSVYQRLQKLENRILELEGLSPEYFQSAASLHKRAKTSAAQACSLTELDGKISAMKAALLKRVTEFGSGCARVVLLRLSLSSSLAGILRPKQGPQCRKGSHSRADGAVKGGPLIVLLGLLSQTQAPYEG
ncbi:MAP3K12-binding inhibitory protein 1 [Merluccius polli]|uniref:MAP3K12-binding inhibitory protein 1 n=1 Tax=Merluccius polli TaxID=89951 RepID=A0AA47M5C2_MERPO|nr:MAP3K12-binding inhibitory protein 1 [Merluccius polli]